MLVISCSGGGGLRLPSYGLGFCQAEIDVSESTRASHVCNLGFGEFLR